MGEAKTSRLAVASLVLGVAGLCTFGLSAPVGLVLGILAFRQLRKGNGMLKGQGFAIGGIATSAVVLVFVLVIILLSLCLRESSSQRAERILRAGRLADVPKSATDVKSEGWHSMFSGADYLMFRAVPEEIERFIAESPSIKDSIPRRFNSEHVYLPYQKDKESRTDEQSEYHYEHEYFFPSPMDPEWYDLTIKVKGRKYEIPGDPQRNGHNCGSVIVNDETSTVYIKVIWS